LISTIPISPQERFNSGRQLFLFGPFKKLLELAQNPRADHGAGSRPACRPEVPACVSIKTTSSIVHHHAPGAYRAEGCDRIHLVESPFRRRLSRSPGRSRSVSPGSADWYVIAISPSYKLFVYPAGQQFGVDRSDLPSRGSRVSGEMKKETAAPGRPVSGNQQVAAATVQSRKRGPDQVLPGEHAHLANAFIDR
jgi:hypothetical protein